VSSRRASSAPPAPPAGPRRAPAPPPTAAEPHEPESAVPTWWWGLLGLAVVLGVALRLWGRDPMWLDEALSVNIATLPLADLLDALERDGHPPLYYLLLHGWTNLFGSGDLAVRSLSALFGVATLPLAWFAGRRYAGLLGAVATLVVLASNPFAIRYSSEARMYSLVILLVLAGWLALQRAEERPSSGRLAAVAAAGGLLLLTHYWAFFLLAAVGGLLALRAARARPGPERARAVRLLGAVAASGVLFLPWLPAFLSQMGATGTPWGRPERPSVVLTVMFRDYGGGLHAEAEVLAFLLLVLVGVGLMGRAAGAWGLHLDLRTRPRAHPEVLVAAGTLGLAVVVGYVADSAFASRYTAIVLPLVVLVVALGITRLPRHVPQGVAVVAVLLLGLYGGAREARTERTQAGHIAGAIMAEAGPSDVVAYCPDQIGVAVSRLLPADTRQMALASEVAPRFVDWVDYEERVAAADTAAFTADVVEAAGSGGTIWLVWSNDYRTHEGVCERVVNDLAALRPDQQVVIESDWQFEHGWLFRYGPTG
jgi:mannosyltransferase